MSPTHSQNRLELSCLTFRGTPMMKVPKKHFTDYAAVEAIVDEVKVSHYTIVTPDNRKEYKI